MVEPRELDPKGSISAKCCLRLIPWAPIALNPPPEVTSDSGIRGNRAGAVVMP